jgi:hypothetical protein
LDDALPAAMSRTSVEPVLLPSLRQSSVPLMPSLAWK